MTRSWLPWRLSLSRTLQQLQLRTSLIAALKSKPGSFQRLHVFQQGAAPPNTTREDGGWWWFNMRHPWKLTWNFLEAKNKALEDDFPFKTGNVQGPCWFSVCFVGCSAPSCPSPHIIQETIVTWCFWLILCNVQCLDHVFQEIQRILCTQYIKISYSIVISPRWNYHST